MSKESWYAGNPKDSVRVCDSDDYLVDYDKSRGMYRVSVFQDLHFVDEFWFDAYEEKELGVIFPQTIGDITFYSKAELFEWVENMQKEFCSPPTGFLGCEVDKPIKIVFEGDLKIASEEDKYEMNMELLRKIGEHNFDILDCSDMTEEEEEVDRIIDEFNSLPNVNPIPYSDLVKAMENQEDVIGDTIKKLSDNT